MAEIKIHYSADEIAPEDWNALSGNAPFARFEFYDALEKSQSVGVEVGWQPVHLAAREGNNLVALMPLFVKAHSQGEYIFDHGFADAYERAGGEYFPKLLAAAPFTPINGPRIFGDANAILTDALQIGQANNFSSFHMNFTQAPDVDARWIERHGVQYHFNNLGYRDFEDFLGRLTASKRKTIRKERREAQSNGIEIITKSGHELDARDWECFWECYQDTGARKWGTPYLTRDFFDIIADTMRDQIVMAMAYRGGKPVASALNLREENRLLGRYWGSLIDQKFLHFELAYYQAIDYAIANNIALIEAGAQGEHKVARGYEPTLIKSYHHFYDPNFHKLVERYIAQERTEISQYCRQAREGLPFKQCE